MKYNILLITVLVVLFSCKEVKNDDSVKKETTKTENIAVNLKSVEVEIEGMTCEIGCARTIQSKLSKVDGITFSKVNFESGKGQFTYNSNKISKNDIVTKINGIAGGDVYSVTKTEELQEIIE